MTDKMKVVLIAFLVGTIGGTAVGLIGIVLATAVPFSAWAMASVFGLAIGLIFAITAGTTRW